MLVAEVCPLSTLTMRIPQLNWPDGIRLSSYFNVSMRSGWGESYSLQGFGKKEPLTRWWAGCVKYV